MLLLEVKSKIENVILYPYSAIIIRSAKINFSSGHNTITLTGLETNIIRESIRITTDAPIKIANTDFKIVKQSAKSVENRVPEIILERFQELKRKMRIIKHEVNSLNKTIEAINQAKRTGLVNFGAKITEQVSEDKLKWVIKYLEKLEGNYLKLKSKKEENLEEINLEMQLIKENYGEISDVIETGEIRIEVKSNTEGEANIQLSYNVGNASWRTSYDLILNDEKQILHKFAEIYQDTGVTWKNVKLELVNKPIKVASIPELTPWYIEAWEPRRMKPLKKTAAHPAPFMEKLPEYEQYEKPDIYTGEFQRYALTSTVTLEPGASKSVYLESMELKGSTRYIWVPPVSQDVIRVLEFEMRDGDLSPGECRVFLDKLFVGVINVPRISKGEKIELPLVIEEKVKGEKRLVDREDKRTGIIKGKAYVKYKYTLIIENLKTKPVELIVRDQIPVSKDPDIEVTLEEVQPKHGKMELGIMEWRIRLEPNEKKQITYTYTVKFPPEKEPSNIP